MKRSKIFLVTLLSGLVLSSCALFSNFADNTNHLDPDGEHHGGDPIECAIQLDKSEVSLKPGEETEITISFDPTMSIAPDYNIESTAHIAIVSNVTNSKFTVLVPESVAPGTTDTLTVSATKKGYEIQSAQLRLTVISLETRASRVVLSEYEKELYPGDDFSFHVSLDVTETNVDYQSSCLSEEIDYNIVNPTSDYSEVDIEGTVHSDAAVGNTITISITADVSGISSITPAIYFITVLDSSGKEPADPVNPDNTDPSIDSGYYAMTHGYEGQSVNVTSVDDLCDQIALAMVERLEYLDVTTKFNNTITESELTNWDYSIFNSFGGISYLDGYQTGNNKTWRIYFSYRYSDAEVSLIASHKTTQTEEKTYDEFKNANFENRLAKTTRRNKGFKKFPIDSSDKSLLVKNSDDLFFAVSNGYKPLFENEDCKPYIFYQRAREICRNFISDDMSDLEKYQTLFDYVVYYTNYDYDALDDYSTPFIYNTCYYLEGTMEYNYAVCDGLSKLYAVLCGIEGLEVKRGLGYSSDGGHAWNYIKYDGKWYLTCPTWGQNDIKAENFPAYGSNCTFVSYEAFGTKSDFFYEISGHDVGSNFEQKVYPSTLGSATDHINITKELATGAPSTVDYEISSQSEFNQLLEISKQNCGGQNFTITIKNVSGGTLYVTPGQNYSGYAINSSYGNGYTTFIIVYSY